LILVVIQSARKRIDERSITVRAPSSRTVHHEQSRRSDDRRSFQGAKPARQDRTGEGSVRDSYRAQPWRRWSHQFDIAQDLADPNSFVAIEVFEDRAALERQESLPEVRRTLAVLQESLVAEPEATVFHVSSSEPWGD